MKGMKVSDRLAKASVAAAKFTGCESASFFFTKQPKEPASVKVLKRSK